MRSTLLLAFIIFLLPFSSAQKFLQIEKTNSLKVIKFYIGDEVTFQLEDVEGQKYWRTEIIEKILLKDDLLIFANGMVKISEISAIRTYEGRRFGNSAALSLYSFGAGWILFSLADAVFGGMLTWSVAIVSGTAFATGYLLKQIFKHKTHRLGKRKRLRLLDVTFKKEFGP